MIFHRIESGILKNQKLVKLSLANRSFWKKTDSCYQKAVLSGDAEKMLGLENCFVRMAREAVFECMIYI